MDNKKKGTVLSTKDTPVLISCVQHKEITFIRKGRDKRRNPKTNLILGLLKTDSFFLKLIALPNRKSKIEILTSMKSNIGKNAKTYMRQPLTFDTLIQFNFFSGKIECIRNP